MVVCVLPCHVKTTCLGMVVDDASVTIGAVTINNDVTIIKEIMKKLTVPFISNHLALYALFTTL